MKPSQNEKCTEHEYRLTLRLDMIIELPGTSVRRVCTSFSRCRHWCLCHASQPYWQTVVLLNQHRPVYGTYSTCSLQPSSPVAASYRQQLAVCSNQRLRSEAHQNLLSLRRSRQRPVDVQRAVGGKMCRRSSGCGTKCCKCWMPGTRGSLARYTVFDSGMSVRQIGRAHV